MLPRWDHIIPKNINPFCTIICQITLVYVRDISTSWAPGIWTERVNNTVHAYLVHYTVPMKMHLWICTELSY